MKSITELILMVIKLFIVYRLALFMTRVIINKSGIGFVFKKTLSLVKFTYKTVKQLAKFVFSKFKNVPEQTE